MVYLFRVDSSGQIGFGHIMRCLAIALQLRDRGNEVQFACRELQDNSIAKLEALNFLVHRLKVDHAEKTRSSAAHSGWLEGNDYIDALATCEILKRLAEPATVILDHYALDYHWERDVGAVAHSITVIDDLADRVHDCDLLIDYNLYADRFIRYNGLMLRQCPHLLGPEFSPLRRQFAETQPGVRDQVGRILVFFGGVDRFDLTTSALQILDRAMHEKNCALHVEVVMGSKSPNRDAVERQCLRLGHSFLEHVEDMAALMRGADLSIGAGGFTSYERIVSGLPSVTVPVADNQKQVVRDLSALGLLFAAESAEDIMDGVNMFLSRPDQLRAMSARCLEQDFRHGADRIANHLTLGNRPMLAADRERTLLWRNQNNVRSYFLNSDKIGQNQHDLWFDQALQDPSRVFRVFEYNGQPCGLAYFSRLQPNEWEWGFYLGERGLAPKLGECLAREALNFAIATLKPDKVLAEVRGFNKASLAIHRTLGFNEKARNEGSIFFVYEVRGRDG